MRISDWSSDVCSSDLRPRDLYAKRRDRLIGRSARARSVRREYSQSRTRSSHLHEMTGARGLRRYADTARESGIHRRHGTSAAVLTPTRGPLTHSFDSPNSSRLRQAGLNKRSEERRVGKEWVRKCRSWWSPY